MVIAHSRFVHIRNSGQEKGHKKLIIKGYASTKGLYDKYGWMKDKDGNIRSFRSLFTDDCVEDMKKQAMGKTIFVDAQHKIATDMGILKILEDNGADEDTVEDVKKRLKQNKLPLAKPIDFEIDNEGFLFTSETNPWFAEVDQDHAKYYDAITNSILEKYIKGYSINFDPVDSVTETDDDGNSWTKFNKVNLYGISYTDNPALETNLFTEVAIRSMMEVRNTIGGNTMNEPNETLKPAEPAPAVKEPEQKVEVKPEPTPKINDDVIQKKIDEGVQAALNKKEVEQQAKTNSEKMEELRKEIEELKRSQSGPRGVVKQDDKFGNMQGVDKEKNLLDDAEKMKAKLNEIIEPHNLYMEDRRKGVLPAMCRGKFFGGFGEAMQLQADLRSVYNHKPGETDEQYRMRMTLLQQNPKDDMVLSRTRTL